MISILLVLLRKKKIKKAGLVTAYNNGTPSAASAEHEKENSKS